MSSADFQISKLRLRAPGLSREQAHRLGERVAQRLAEMPIKEIRGGTIPALTVRVNASTNRSIEILAERIANQIRRKLG